MNSNKLKNLREKKGLLQKQLAIDLNISTSAIGMYEQGRREADHATLKKIANYFNVSIDYLLDNEKEKYKEEYSSIEYDMLKKLCLKIGFIDDINEEISQDDLERLIKFIKQNKDFIKNHK